jgi:hypothetical protein
MTNDNSNKEYIRLDEKRFLTLDEFCQYTSIGKNNARILAKRSNVQVFVTNKILIDRVKFDRLCDEDKL